MEEHSAGTIKIPSGESENVNSSEKINIKSLFASSEERKTSDIYFVNIVKAVPKNLTFSRNFNVFSVKDLFFFSIFA